MWFFDVAGETVWGATARTLMELICLVLGVDVPASPRAQASDGLTPALIGGRIGARDRGPAPASQAVSWGAVGWRTVGAATDRRCGELRPGSGGTVTWLS